MSDITEISLDTSVLFNYVYSNLPGDIERDRGCQRLIDEPSYRTVIGGKAEREFDAGCNRRYKLYDDIQDFLHSTDQTIFEYEPLDRDIHTSPNDLTHLRKNIKMNWHDTSERKQLSLLRRCLQDLELYQVRVPTNLIDKCFPQQSNEDLLNRLEANLDIDHDCEILVDAAEISYQHSIVTLIAVDSDITDEDQVDLIYEILEEVIGVPNLLSIAEPDDL